MRFDVGSLPETALAAAAEFHAKVLPGIAALPVGEDLCLVFQPTDHTHAAWRTAAVQGLAREQAPRRVNGVASDSEAAIAAACAYLAEAPGVTGQYWALDADGASGA